MTTAIRLHAVVTVPGRPPSLNARYGHHMARHRESAMWTERTHLLALEARHRAGWRPLEECEPAMRWLTIDTYRRGELDPIDNGPGSLKPILDGLKGVLLWDDSARYVRLACPIRPHRVTTVAEERTIIRVSLAEPA